LSRGKREERVTESSSLEREKELKSQKGGEWGKVSRRFFQRRERLL